MTKQTLKILHLEDLATDAELVERALRNGGIQFELLLACSRKEFIKALATFPMDIILSDHSLPTIDSFEAIKLTRQSRIKAPLILVTGAISEEYAVEIMKQGAYDYVLKDHLERLPKAVINAIEKFTIEDERRTYFDIMIASEARFRQIVETAQEGIWIIDENNRTLYANKKMGEILEYSPQEMMGKESAYFMDEEGKQNAIKRMDEAEEGITENIELRYVAKNGKHVWTNVSGSPVYNEDGTCKGTLRMVTNITERKLVQDALKESEANLAVKNKEFEQKNEELEQFAYVASHDLQEPLRTMSSLVKLIRRKCGAKREANLEKYLTYLEESSERMKDLISDLLDYSQIGTERILGQVDCNILLAETLTDLDKAIKESGITIRAGQLPVIEGRWRELKQLFQNLVSNAIKFRKKDTPGELVILAEKAGNHWKFSFQDNGIGIAEEFWERIFVIFQRLHNRTEYEGSGIGLAHCKKIVELHNGEISIKSQPGEGTIFYFTIQETG